ncbi:hypothetical protein [Streptomyces subrutilus]|uniref:DNA (cytosine-5-)-methyltransferase n=1 Tax=Streptomyces subrutilus TaxID=36818 RepID=A0A1E5PXE0_9ACTN|nr:hypothetical protein [Streptomyces subrutilus]OEJ34176.1 hypothetical protein BGK67_25100 [Streptomyces subrutilus]
MLAKHEKTRAEMAKNVAKRDKGAPEWKPFGKGQITLKPRKAPKTDKTPADILKAWSGEVIHDIACNHCGEFDCTCVRDVVSAVLANHGGPVVDADAVDRGRQSLTEQTTTVRHECADQITLGADVPEPVAEIESAPEFPADLMPGESVEPYEGEHHRADDDGWDWVLTLASGDQYRMFSRGYERGRWQVVRGVHDSTFWWAELDEDNSLAAAVAWCRADSASAAWAQDVWARYGHMNEERVTWSAELVQTELEPRLFRVERYGRVGIMAKYAWGWEHRPNGLSAEAGTSGAVDGMFRKRAAHKLTVAGLREIPLDRWVITGTDGVREKYGVHGKTALECGPGSWDEPGLCIGACWNKNAPARFVVDILAEDGVTVMGTVGVCALHLARPLAKAFSHTANPWDVAYERCGKTSGAMGSALDWEERYCDLIAEMVTAALDAGEHNPRPDVVAALYAEADAIRAQQEAKAAKTAKKITSTGGESSTMGRGSMAPKKTTAVKVGDILFSDKSAFPCVAELLGHRYVVRKLAGSFSAQHEHSDGGRLIFDGEDKKNICRTGGDMFPNLPAVKRAILADAVARGAVEEQQPGPVVEVGEEQPDALCEECEQYEDECACYDPFAEEVEPERESEAVKRFPELERWLADPQAGDRPRVLNLFCGPGGACVALRRGLGLDVDMLCVDLNGDAVKTQQAAGCWVIQADVTTLDPSDPVFAHVSGTIITAPCTDYTDAGKRWGRLPENIDLLAEMWDVARHAAGRIPMGDGHDHAPDFGVESSFREPSGRTWEEVREEVREDYQGNDGFLMLEIAVWVNGLKAAGAPLEWVAVEQSSKLPAEIVGEIRADFQLSGWAMADVRIEDAAQYGAPAHRVRTLVVARLEGTDVTMDAPGLVTGLAEGTGLPEGTVFITRGNRKTSGGNLVTVTNEPGPSPTSRARSWDMDVKGGRMAVEHMAKWVTMPADHPVQGSRTSLFQQLADVVMPVMGIALLGVALGVEWRPALGRYLAEQYPQVHSAADTEEIPVEESPAGGAQDPEPADTGESAPEWSYETERAPREGCGSFPEPCNHAWPCGRDAVAWNKAQARERMERAAATPGAQLTEGESVTYAGASDDGYGHNFERMAYDWVIAEGRFRTTSNDLGDKHRHHGESPKGNNGWTISVRCLHETCMGKVFKSVICDSEAVLAMRAHGRKKHPVPVAPKAGEPGFMAALLEKHVGADWTPLAATAEPAFSDDQEEPQAAVQGPLTREQRRAAWRLAAVEPAPVQEKPVAVLPSAGRGFWEIGEKVLHEGRAGRVVSAKIGKTIVLMDGAEPGHLEHVEPRALVAENFVMCGTLVQLSVPRRAVALEEPKAPVCEALETYVVPEVPALVICGELFALAVPKRVVDPRIAWAAYERPAPVDPRLEWARYEQPEPEQVDVLAELRAELEELRRDVETWGAEVAALAVAEAERVVAEVARDMRAAELLVLREEAKELRESLGWGPMAVVPVEVATRVRPWRSLFATAASLAGLVSAGFSEGWEAGMRG